MRKEVAIIRNERYISQDERYRLKEYQVLKKAPITEALIDIRVKLPKDVEVERIKSIHTEISAQYSEERPIKTGGFKIDVQKGKPVNIHSKIDGYSYVSADKTQMVQLRSGGFTFNKLKPYKTWNDLRGEAQRLWRMYSDIVSPESISRVAVRYINNLNIPMPAEDLGDYLTSPPIVPRELPQYVSSFLNRVVIPGPSAGVFAIITQALEKKVIESKTLPILLDIDVAKTGEQFEEEDIWKTLEELRIFKNVIFFSSITEKLREMYE